MGSFCVCHSLTVSFLQQLWHFMGICSYSVFFTRTTTMKDHTECPFVLLKLGISAYWNWEAPAFRNIPLLFDESNIWASLNSPLVLQR